MIKCFFFYLNQKGPAKPVVLVKFVFIKLFLKQKGFISLALIRKDLTDKTVFKSISFF